MYEATTILYVLFLSITLFLSFYSWLYLKEVGIIKRQVGLTIPKPLDFVLPALLVFSLLASVSIFFFILNHLK